MSRSSDERLHADSPDNIAKIIKSGGTGKFSEGSITGLHLQVSATSQLWRLKCFLHGKEILYSIGAYPDVSLEDARQQAEVAREDVARGVHPKQARDARREEERAKAAWTFAKLAEQWMARHAHLKPKTIAGRQGVLKNHLLPVLGNLHVKDIAVRHIRAILGRIEDSPTMQRESLRLLSKILAHAMDHDLVPQNIAVGREGLLDAKPKTKHHAALIKEDDLLDYIRRLDKLGNSGNDCAISALWLLLLIPARPSELCAMRWSQIDLDAAEWTYQVPKTGQIHTVPLPTQALAQLNGIRDYSLTVNKRAAVNASPFGRTSDDEAPDTPDWVFPSVGTFGRPLASETLLRRLRSDLDYPVGAITGHGFRSTFRSLGEEVLEIDPLLLELQLGHRMPGSLGATYQRLRLLPQRREAMQRWANYIEGLYWKAVNGVSKDDAERALATSTSALPL
ncbi:MULTISPECIES: site-specific integrase [Pseudomonas]|uniref:tyrosine-type recombinase/integrase n=1 Tax=Pseudomonas TaxID=286 RepID=UPI001AE533F5|nr:MULTISPECIES: site-specific integrase [Pseudomonas]MBP2083510.1 integrase [Pseudomonas sp. PvP089]MBP2090787.1 integrase [Pseudomonas sp. PvP088]MBP2223049.1 integrase [Pseudomonas putida]